MKLGVESGVFIELFSIATSNDVCKMSAFKDTINPEKLLVKIEEIVQMQMKNAMCTFQYKLFLCLLWKFVRKFLSLLERAITSSGLQKSLWKMFQ